MKNQTYTIKPFSLEDYEFVYNTKKTVYKQYVESNWGEWNEDTQQKMFAQFIDQFGNNIVIITINNNKIGFYHGENLDNNSYEIGNICIIPEYQGKGIGSTILKDIIAKHRHQDIYLRYFKQNPVERLYLRLGFEIIEEQPYHFKMKLKSKHQCN